MTRSDTTARAIAYHERTKHAPGRSARSLGYMDWATQPDPFRRYEGARRVPLERFETGGGPAFDAVYRPEQIEPAALDRASVSRLLFDTLALSAWKRFGNNRWSLRCNPSSGNLHPTEGYLCLPAIDGVADTPAVHHYCALDHALEARLELGSDEWHTLTAGLPGGAFLVGFTSIHWRESWKYGERAYRYCQHDAGHAIAQVAYAAAALGWHVRLLEGAGDDAIARLLGIDRQRGVEAEHPDALLCVSAEPPSGSLPATWAPPEPVLEKLDRRDPAGTPNALSPEHHPWEIIDDVAEACHRDGPAAAAFLDPRDRGAPPALPERNAAARHVFRIRRSAVAMDGETGMTRDAFLHILRRMMPASAVPFASLPWRPSIHPMLLVHRVEGIVPGMYLLWRDPDRAEYLKPALQAQLEWNRVPGAPEDLPLYRLKQGDLREFARTINCEQEIASDGAFAVEMLAEFEPALHTHGSWVYRRLHWEAGALGQLLYLEAEAAGLRGTGIGCFFDDTVHRALGIADRSLQMLYGFTVGGPVEDPRLVTEPAYFHLDRADSGRD